MAIAALAIIPAGCGDSDSASSASNSPGPPPTKARFVEEAETICTQTDIEQQTALDEYVEKHPKAKSSEAGEKAFVLAAGLPPVQEEAERVGDLQTPSGDEQRVKAIVEAIEAAVEKVEAKPELLLETGSQAFATAEKLATKYGLEACAEPL